MMSLLFSPALFTTSSTHRHRHCPPHCSSGMLPGRLGIPPGALTARKHLDRIMVKNQLLGSVEHMTDTVTSFYVASTRQRLEKHNPEFIRGI